jgi:hypothetical protein
MNLALVETSEVSLSLIFFVAVDNTRNLSLLDPESLVVRPGISRC